MAGQDLARLTRSEKGPRYTGGSFASDSNPADVEPGLVEPAISPDTTSTPVRSPLLLTKPEWFAS